MPDKSRYVSQKLIDDVFAELNKAAAPLFCEDISRLVGKAERTIRNIITILRQAHQNEILSYRNADNRHAYMLAKNSRWLAEYYESRQVKRREGLKMRSRLKRDSAKRAAYQREHMAKVRAAQKQRAGDGDEDDKDYLPVMRKIAPASVPLPFRCNAVRSVFDLGRV